MPDKISVGLVSRTFFNLPLWAAMENGFFADEDIAVETTIIGNASQVPPLLDGTFQIMIGGCEPVIQNVASGGPLRIVAGNTGKVTHSLIARAPFKIVRNLKGATIGILSQKEGTFFQLKEMLEKHGLHFPGDYNVKDTGGVPPRHKALLEGTIDAGLQSIPWNYVAEDAGMNNLGDVIDYIPDWQFVSTNTNGEWARANRELLVRFLRGIFRGTSWFYENREASARIAERELPAPLAHAERAWDHYTGTNALTRDVSVNDKGLRKVIDTLIQAGLLDRSAPREPSAYVVSEYLEAARGH